jgi:hypothetical protein
VRAPTAGLAWQNAIIQGEMTEESAEYWVYDFTDERDGNYVDHFFHIHTDALLQVEREKK